MPSWDHAADGFLAMPPERLLRVDSGNAEFSPMCSLYSLTKDMVNVYLCFEPITEAGGPRGYDAGKKVKGCKRHVAVDTLRLPGFGEQEPIVAMRAITLTPFFSMGQKQT